MKVSVITRHAISNYGSLLQAYATQVVLQKLGFDAEIIDYVRSDEEYRNIAKTQLSLNKKWNRNFFARTIYLALQTPEYIEAGRKFEKMQRQHLNLTRRYSTYDELIASPPVSDIYCTGSDQVWGPIGTDKYDPAYFLDFIATGNRKVAYAASFGRTQFDTKTIDEYQKMLKNYDCIAVRENSALDILHRLKITQGVQVLDPTLLISKEEWCELLEDTKPEAEPYVLLYNLGNATETDEFARAFAKRKGLPLIRVTATRHWKTSGARNILLPSLNEFLSYIRHASYMITNSFHGTAFALNFGTQFVDVIPKVTGTRNLSVLSLVGLQNRVISDFSDDSILDDMIDFSTSHTILDVERKKSKQSLKKMLEAE